MSEPIDSGISWPVVPMRYFAAEAAHRDGQATDALFLTFNADLAFFESRLLDLCRQAGARVTVIADASVWAPDVRSVTRAGVRYHVGLVATGAAFHPKISLIVGPKRALAVVGSGNLGMAGWQHNAELATVMAADLQSAPRAMADLSHLLGTLADRPELDPTSADAISRAADQLAELLAGSAQIIDTGHRLAATWDGPLIDQLPLQPVDELLLTAAFHDPDSAAVETLLRRLQPKHVRVAIQPGATVVDPAALDHVLTEYGTATAASTAVVRDPETRRYRHGKLIEWSVDGRRTALSGSPNLSRMALLRSVPSGNFEVALIAPTEKSLFPGGEMIERVADVAVRVALAPAGPGSRRPIATSAVLTGTTLTVRLARVRADADIEFARYADPDLWQHLAPIPAGEKIVSLQSDLGGGDRIRLAWADEDGVVHLSPAVFVTDPAIALRRPSDPSRVSRIREASPSDLWGDDPSFLDSLFGELAALSEELSGRKASPSADAPREAAPRSRTTPERTGEPWLWLREDTIGRLGPGIGPYVFGLPPLPPGRREDFPNWTDDQGLETGTEAGSEVDQEQAEPGDEESVVVEPTQMDHTQSPLGVRKASTLR